MNWDQIEGKWKQAAGAAKAHWGKLSSDEVDQVDGNRQRLEGLIQERYGVAKEDAQKQVDEWLETRH